MQKVEMIRVTNITNRNAPAGEMLDMGEDFKGVVIAPGRSKILRPPGGQVPDFLMDWVARGKVVIHDGSSGDSLGSGAEYGTDLTPKRVAPVREANGEQDLDNNEIDGEPDLSEEEAVEAAMPRAGAVLGRMQGTEQAPRARVELGMSEGTGADEVIGGELTPLPGERPRDIDNAQNFTVKAGRQRGPGAVIR